MRKLRMMLAVVCIIAMTGCATENSAFFGGVPEKLSAQEVARRKAAAMHGNRKPYTYTWSEETADGYVKHGQAIVVPN